MVACEARSGIREEGLVGVGAALHPVSLVLGGAPCPDPCCPRVGVLTGARLTPQALQPPARRSPCWPGCCCPC